MSAGADDGALEKSQRLIELAKENPLARPTLSSIALHDFEYMTPRYLRSLMAEVYRALEDHPGQPKRMCKLYPRDHAKSETGSHIVPSWKALANPNVRVLILMESESKAKEKLNQCRKTINKWGPRFGRQIDKDSATDLTLRRTANHAEPTIAARGMDSKITGGHYDLLIFDDIVSWPTQRTETQRQKRWSQFQDYSQNLGAAGDSVYLVLGTRKHPEDLYSKLIHSPNWNVEVKQAISDYSVIENGEFTVTTDAGNTYSGAELSQIDAQRETILDIDAHREVDVLWPERWSLENLIDKLLTEVQSEDGSALVFKRENQNDPRALEGQVLNADQLVFEPRSALPDQGVRFVAGVDVGIEDDPEKAAVGDSDWWSVAVYGDHPPSSTTFLVELERKRGITMSRAISWISRVVSDVEGTFGHPVSRINVEGNQAQRWLVQEARDKDLRFQTTTSSGSKEERIISMAGRFESGRVRIIDDTLSKATPVDERAERAGAKWQSFIDEWVGFPTGKHDDRLDSCEIGLRGISTENVTDSDYDMSDLPT
ncbi:hypothetical protein [Natronosalvus rutilus]|uniref:Terminase large subunit gp17-like C-terminal domain-containing protein n=1 Tax=Natronosalvus rutilus TaxID=2953753 RepID=A0A9E7NER6_9EURY|nr:hypothetical protein [Natronosalvus rutilus]UTF56001.1 hypothetical protein NGM29_20655 [Natronosalvus rutilus]